MANTIELTRSDATETTFRGRHAYQISISAVSTIDGISSKILVMHSGAGVEGSDIFSCVASLPQLQELPEDVPVVVGDEVYPFYRVASVDFIGYTYAELDTLWIKIIEDVGDLIENARLLSQYGTSITSTFTLSSGGFIFTPGTYPMIYPELEIVTLEELRDYTTLDIPRPHLLAVNVPGLSKLWVVQDGTGADNGDWRIRPNDYAPITNEVEIVSYL